MILFRFALLSARKKHVILESEEATHATQRAKSEDSESDGNIGDDGE